MLQFQPDSQLITADDFPALCQHLKHAVLCDVSLVQLFTVTHDQMPGGELGCAQAFHRSLRAAQAATASPGCLRHLQIHRVPALALDFGWQTVLVTLNYEDDFASHVPVRPRVDGNVVSLDAFRRPQPLLSALEFRSLQPWLRSLVEGGGFSQVILSPSETVWHRWCPQTPRRHYARMHGESLAWRASDLVLPFQQFAEDFGLGIVSEFERLAREEAAARG